MTKIEWTHHGLAKKARVRHEDDLEQSFAGDVALRRHPFVNVPVALGAVAAKARGDNVARRRAPALADWNNVIPACGRRFLAVRTKAFKTLDDVGLLREGWWRSTPARNSGPGQFAMAVRFVSPVLFTVALAVVRAAAAVPNVADGVPVAAIPAPRATELRLRDSLVPRRSLFRRLAALAADGRPAIRAMPVRTERVDGLPSIATVAPLLTKSPARLVFSESHTSTARGSLQCSKCRAHRPSIPNAPTEAPTTFDFECNRRIGRKA